MGFHSMDNYKKPDNLEGSSMKGGLGMGKYKKTDNFIGTSGGHGTNAAARRAGKSSSLKGGAAAGFRGYTQGRVKGR